MLIISEAKKMGGGGTDIYRTFLLTTQTQHSHKATVQHFSGHLENSVPK